MPHEPLHDDGLGRAGQAVISLYGPRGQRIPMHGGSGVLATIGERVIILTAAHVHLGLEENRKGAILAAFGGRLIPLNGRIFRTEAVSNGIDGADSAVLIVDPGEGADHLRGGAISLATDATYDDIPIRSSMGLRGYPHRYGEKVRGSSLVAKWFSWFGYSADMARVPNLPPATAKRVAMDVPPDKLVDPTGVPSRAVSTSGCSGAGMWLLGTNGPPKLAAIFTEVRGDFFVGTSVRTHVGLLYANAPELFDSAGTT